MLASEFNLMLTRHAARGLLPLALGSRAARARLTRDVRRNALFSARTTNADYLHFIFGELSRMLEGGYESDPGMIRLRAKALLAHLEYDPMTGFPGDAERGIPPAEPGSLQDLSSDARLNLIIDTQEALMRGAVNKAQGMEPTAMKLFPWWELVRIESRRVPRGDPDSGTKGWNERWTEAAGPAPVTDGHRTRLIAAKDHHVWRNLGDAGLFEDALDVEHPPFAFRSGMGWRSVHYSEGKRLGLDLPAYVFASATPAPGSKPITLPKPQASVKRFTEAEKEVLRQAQRDLGEVKSYADILKLS